MSIKNIKDLTIFIEKLETEFNLLNLSISGVKPWQANRYEIMYEIGKQLGVYEKTVKRHLSKKDKFRSLFSMLKNTIVNSPLSKLSKVDVLLFPHARSQKVNGTYVDIYTHYIKQEMIDSANTFIEFEEHHNGKHIRNKTETIRYLDYISIYRNIFSRFVKVKLSSDILEIISNVEKKLKQNGVNINLLKIFVERTKKFIIVKNIYSKILKQTSPEKIYIVVSYGRAELIDAAKDMGIDIIELQHGTFSKYHLGYSFKTNPIQYFPTHFLAWNQFWKDMIVFPIDYDKVNIYPFKFLELKKGSLLKKKDNNKTLIIGQGGLTESMLQKIIENKGFFKSKNLYLKLHPNEYEVYQKYSMLPVVQKELNLKVLKNVDLYGELATSEYVLGVYSTVLYEAIEFECKPVLFDLPGIEYMDKYCEKYRPAII